LCAGDFLTAVPIFATAAASVSTARCE
jgi:hypothetical protein